ncbi:hypothetical protein NL676_019050 [Syzygium grande]|nr:hypothetical protein NL676_019050 [Syzygium grande]
MTEAREEKTDRCDDGCKRKQQSESDTDSPGIASEESSSSNGSSSDLGDEMRRQSLVQHSSMSLESPDPHVALESTPGESGSSETSPSNSEETPSSVSTIQSVSRKSSSSGSSSSGGSSSDSAREMRRRTLGQRSPSYSSDPESDSGLEQHVLPCRFRVSRIIFFCKRARSHRELPPPGIVDELPRSFMGSKLDVFDVGGLKLKKGTVDEGEKGGPMKL